MAVGKDHEEDMFFQYYLVHEYVFDSILFDRNRGDIDQTKLWFCE